MAILAAHNNDAVVSRAFVQTTNTGLALNGTGQTGIKIVTSTFTNMLADYNTLNNCVNSIYLSA